MAVEKKQILNKLYLLTGFLFLFALAIIYQLIQIEYVDGDAYRAQAEQGTVKTFEIAANRGSVYTSDGSLLATSVSRFDIRMDVVTVSDEDFENGIKGLSVSLSEMLGKSAGYYENKIRKARVSKNRYLFITRNLSYTEYQKLKEFPIFKLGAYRGGFIVEQRTVREHPIGKIAERAVGYDDYRGRVGIEGSFYEFLRGKKGKRLKQKIAKGQWKPLNDNNEIEPIDGKDINSAIFKNPGPSRRVSDTDNQELASIFSSEDWFRFSFVRNPYKRLLSAYKDKILGLGHPKKHNSFLKKINWNSTQLPSFEEFIVAISRQSDDAMDWHWMPQSRLIMPDIIHYDFIGKLENYNEDMRTVLTRLNTSPNIIDKSLSVSLNSRNNPASFSG